MPFFQKGCSAFVPEIFRKKKKKVFAVDEDVTLEDNLFPLERDEMWQLYYTVGVSFAFVFFGLWCWGVSEDIVLYFPVHFLRRTEYEDTAYLEAHNSYFLFVAFLLDFKEFYYVARYVVCILPWWLPMVEADLRPSVNSLIVDDLKISMLDIKDVFRFNERWCQILAANYTFMSMPWCLISLWWSELNAVYVLDYVVNKFFAAIFLLRIFFGVDCFIKFVNAMEWMYKTDNKDRDEIGAVLTTFRTRAHGFYIMLVSGLVMAGGMKLSMRDDDLIIMSASIGTSGNRPHADSVASPRLDSPSHSTRRD
mmetsp:Transcript_73940/g.211074  ORF Transcript_73940/g.211074 Transcript_73940/m.211074 type:complete len:308 (+) Transcript_73940:2142-3065(+)